MFGTVGMLGIKNSKLSRVLAFKVDRSIHFANSTSPTKQYTNITWKSRRLMAAKSQKGARAKQFCLVGTALFPSAVVPSCPLQ